jgi:hypothetical protein
LSIQKKAPSFLGYKSKIEEDTKIIEQHKEKITSLALKKMIDAIIK